MDLLMLLCALASLVFGATLPKDVVGSANRDLFPELPNSRDPQLCNGSRVGTVTNPDLNELSGLVASHRYPDVFYSIEDSKNGNFVYAINKNGTLITRLVLEGVKNNDFEDIALSLDPKDEKLSLIHI